MKVQELFEEEEIRTAFTVTAGSVAQWAPASKVKLERCSTGPRDLVSAIVIAEGTWMDEKNHPKLEELAQSINAAVTDAMFKETQKRIKTLKLDPKEFLMYVKNKTDSK